MPTAQIPFEKIRSLAARDHAIICAAAFRAAQMAVAPQFPCGRGTAFLAIERDRHVLDMHRRPFGNGSLRTSTRQRHLTLPLLAPIFLLDSGFFYRFDVSLDRAVARIAT